MAEKLTTLAKRLRPFIISQAAASAASGALGPGEGPGIDVIGNVVGFGGDSILLYDSAGAPVAEYALSAAGLTAGLAAMGSGEYLRINAACTITGNFTIPAGGELRSDSEGQITIIGTISTGAGSKLTNITIAAVANSAGALYGITGPSTGSAYLSHCDISAIQSGSGNAYAVGAINNGNLYVDDCKLFGDSVGGSGYAGRSTAGYLYVTGNTGGAIGSTDRFTTV